MKAEYSFKGVCIQVTAPEDGDAVEVRILRKGLDEAQFVNAKEKLFGDFQRSFPNENVYISRSADVMHLRFPLYNDLGQQFDRVCKQADAIKQKETTVEYRIAATPHDNGIMLRYCLRGEDSSAGCFLVLDPTGKALLPSGEPKSIGGPTGEDQQAGWKFSAELHHFIGQWLEQQGAPRYTLESNRPTLPYRTISIDAHSSTPQMEEDVKRLLEELHEKGLEAVKSPDPRMTVASNLPGRDELYAILKKGRDEALPDQSIKTVSDGALYQAAHIIEQHYGKEKDKGTGPPP